MHGPFWGPERGYNRGNYEYLKTIPFTYQWYEATLEQGDSSVLK